MTQNLTDLNKREIYFNNEGKAPTAFVISIPHTANESTERAVKVLVEELEEFTPHHVVERADKVFNGKKEIVLSPDMLLMRLEYPDSPARWVVYTFSEEENYTLTKDFVKFPTVH